MATRVDPYQVQDCACGGSISVNVGNLYTPDTYIAAAVQEHQQTDQHRDWLAGPAFLEWQNQWNSERKN